MEQINKKAPRKLNKKKVALVAVIGIVAFVFLMAVVFFIRGLLQPNKHFYIAGPESSLVFHQVIDGEVSEQTCTVIRGSEVTIKKKPSKKETNYIVVYQKDKEKFTLQVAPEFLVENLEEVVTNQEVYARLLVNLRENRDSDLSDVILERYECVPVKRIDYERDFVTETGEVLGYTIEKDGKEYYVLSRYVEPTLDLAKIDYSGSVAYSTYWDNYFGEGFSKETYIDSIDYKPVNKLIYEDNPLKGNINAVHIGMSLLSSQSDYLIQLCQESGINALVLEVKSDEGYLAYESEYTSQYLKDNEAVSKRAMSKKDFEALVKKYKEAGIYLIARIVTFKDPIFASQWNEEAILNSDGTLFKQDGLTWPSAYSRKAWQYNVSIAKEVAKMGFNEVQFDYVRFPDGLGSKERAGQVELNNHYGENKVQALQHFLMYAYDELSPLHVYLAADVFGWPAVARDDQNIGQFIPAISQVVDVISPMPYADHFGANSFGIPKPWQEPGRLLKEYSSLYIKINNSIHSPAIYRTWIQGYACLGYVCTGSSDNPKRSFDSHDMIAQIKGIQEVGFEGYMVWSGEGSESMLSFRKDGFIDSKLDDDQKYVHQYQTE